ncbi:MAG TPA: hypothetical protein VGD54_07550 [Steroidobacteraceae bacterium]
MRFIKGGRLEFMALARLAPAIEPELAQVIEAWDKLSKTGQRDTTIESLCLTRQVDPLHFLSVVAEASMKFRDNSTLLIAALNMPEVVMQSIKFAKQPEGFKDREALMKHSGFIPTPTGSRINILNSASAKAGAQSEANVERGLPSFEQSMSDLEDE